MGRARGNSVKAFPRDRENSRNNEEPSSQPHSTVLGAVYLCLDQSMTNIVEKILLQDIKMTQITQQSRVELKLKCFILIVCFTSFSDEILLAAEHYQKLFEEERDRHNRYEKKLDTMDKKLDVLLARQEANDTHKSPTDLACLADRSDPQWDEWLLFRNAVGDFDAQKFQYILFTDSVPQQNLESYSILRSVTWKMILDFDPMSEEEGFYREFTSKEGQSNLVTMFTPAELNQSTMKSLLRQIDPNKIQWVFVNGRSGDSDGGSQENSSWEASSMRGISSLFRCCSDPDTFDELKPVICLILPLKDSNLPHLQVTLGRLVENFYNLNLEFVSVADRKWPCTFEEFKIQGFHLGPKILHLGLKDLLDTSAGRKLCMPTSLAGVTVHLSPRQYLYLKELLDIMYLGCEDLPEDNGSSLEYEEQQDCFLEHQRKSFLSGNQISFASLSDNHDARREIERDIRVHVQRLLDQGLAKPVFVEVRHLPGTGGSTIARRVLWELHKDYPCALIDISSHRYSDEDNTLANQLAERIASLEEICNTTPLILVDGKQSGALEGLTNKLSRILQNKGKRVMILRCLRGSKVLSKRTEEASQLHKVFHVNVKLEESVTDLREFKSKYKEYIDCTINKSLATKNALSSLCRVFHFPLLAMMEEFRPKLEKIIEDTFNDLGGIQQEIAVVVAFLQKYANLPTPALLLYEAFNQFIRMSAGKSATYDDISQLFSESLMNLMTPTKPTRCANKNPPESYTFQHPLVADLILKRVYHLQKRDLFAIVETFLKFPIYQEETLLPLIFELFVYNKTGTTGHEKLKFSILFEELKENDSDRAEEIFCQAAEKLNDPVTYANAARFCARKEPPSFPKAKMLIQQALKIHGSTTKGGYKNLCHTKGVVLYFELRHMIKSGEVKHLNDLEAMASNVLEAHREARNFPPTYPHPLIGEVEVWLECINWIMNNMCSGDTEETLGFLTNLAPPFFRTCLSDSFYLLDIVDGIVQSVPHLADPAETKRLCNHLRLSLMTICRTRSQGRGRRKADEDIVQACRAMCTTKHFRESSQLELKRLQAHFILSHSESIDNLKKENLEYLLKLLEDLVLKEDEFRLAQHLMKVSMLVTGPRSYSLEQGLHVCEKWLVVSSHGCLPEFYKMAIYFLQILDGNSLEFMPKYIQALEKCREKCQNDMRRFYPTHYVANEGQGMSRLISRHTLLRGETDYSSENVETVSRFWQVGSRKKLQECKGRIRVRQPSGRVKSQLQPYIELLQGNLELYVGKHADIGKAEIDFTPGALVYFVVSFNLQGPVANGITFSPQNPSND